MELSLRIEAKRIAIYTFSVGMGFDPYGYFMFIIFYKVPIL